MDGCGGAAADDLAGSSFREVCFMAHGLLVESS